MRSARGTRQARRRSHRLGRIACRHPRSREPRLRPLPGRRALARARRRNRRSRRSASSHDRALAAGEPALSPGLAGKILEEFARIGHDAEPPERDDLTAREQEVLQLVAEGLTNKEIAARLFLSEHTVSFHVKNILAKLHLRNRAQAVACAVRTGLAKPVDDT